QVAVALFFAVAADVGQAAHVAHDHARQLLRGDGLGQQLFFQGSDVGLQFLHDRRQAIDRLLREQTELDAMEAAEARILFAFLEVVGTGVDRVVQFSQT
nr:hypothetical protein [Tanacetum cinerariifolium]